MFLDVGLIHHDMLAGTIRCFKGDIGQYLFKDGVTAGQEAGGFAPTENSKSINWIITPRKAPIAVSKTDKMRIFDPETNQKARAWAMDYRKFHDLWIPDKKVEQCFVNVKEALA